MTRNKYLIATSFFIALAGLMVLWLSCNKGYDRALKHQNYEDTTSAVGKDPHVLYIVIDGARGQSVREVQPPNIMSLTDHAIYSWNDVTDVFGSKMTGWADLLTGVHQDKHQVLNGDLSQSDLKDYPVFFNYIKEREADFRITAFSASDSIKPLITGADVDETFHGDDAATAKAALNELTRDSSRLVFVEFSGVDSAGAQYGYDASVPQYKAAILQTDKYIGQMLAAIRAHKDYAHEDWMVVITSDHGGPFQIPPSENDQTVLSDPTRNSFVIFYTSRYQPDFIDKPFTGDRYVGKSIELHGSDTDAVNAIVPDDHGDFNFGDSIEFTIAMKIKIRQDAGGGDHSFSDYPSLLGKRESFNRGVPGWCIYLNQKHWAILFENTNGFSEAIGPDISDGTWHDIAVVVENRAGHRYERAYTDGNFNAETEVTIRGNINSKAPLTLGYLPGIGAGVLENVYVSDLRIWRTALDDATIGQYACQTSLADDNPFNNYLLGYWPCTDGEGGVFKDNGTLQHDLEIQGPYQWEDFNDLVCAPSAGNLAELMPQPVDITRQILNWLQMAPDPKWGLDGRVWTTNYVGIKQ